MPRYGVILETRDDRAVISAALRGVCAECSSRSSCSFESALGKDRAEKVTALNPIGARPGDYVEFDLPGRTELKLSILIWAVPLFGLMTGAWLGAKYFALLSLAKDPATFLGGLAGLVLCVLPAVIYERLAKHDSRLIPRVLRTMSPSACPVDIPGVPVKK